MPEDKVLLADLRDRLARHGVAGTIEKYLAGATPGALATFAEELSRRDFEWIRAHRAALLGGAAAGAAVPAAADLAPVEPGTVGAADRPALGGIGRASLAAGEWASIVFAGGAATRFYSDARDDPRVAAVIARHGSAPPKGLFPLTPVMGFPFLDLFAAEALAAGVAAGRMPVMVMMTSSLTDAAVRAWAADADLWGFPRNLLVVLGQTEQPRLDADGDLVVGPDGHMVVTGDGHGGVYKALLTPGSGGARGGASLADRLRAWGVRRVVLHNVDNAASHPFDAARIGFHVRGGYGFTLTVVSRARLSEKVGLVARNPRTGGIEVIEYSVCPREVAEAADPDGRPVLRLAHINTNLVDLDAIRPDIPPTLYTGKKVEVGGRTVESSSFEMLNQHLSGLLPPGRVGVLLADRAEYFLPTKTVTGEDSLEDTAAALNRAATERLRSAGAVVEASARVEIDPCVAAGLGGAGPGWRVGEGAAVYLGVRHGEAGAPPFAAGLEVGAGAAFLCAASRPYGEVRPSADRRVSESPALAGRVRIGRGAVVEPGAHVTIRVEGDGAAVVPDGARLSGRVAVVVPPGGCATIA